MLTIEQALERILSNVPAMPVETVPLSDAYGRVLAEELRSTVDVPPWDNSAMDGYAVRAEDTREGEVALRLLETVGAGAVASGAVEPGTAVGIMTGAPVPAGADAVVPVEDTTFEPAPSGTPGGAREGVVRIRGFARPGQHVRQRGEDVRSGEVVLSAGARLTAAAVGLASSLGRPSLVVRRRPVVAILSTGDEVVPPGQALQPGQIWSSNNASLCGLVIEAGGVPLDLGNVPDQLEVTVAALRRAADQADVVVTTGGVSVGHYDVVKDAFGAVGAAIDFWRVKMKPGKPLAFGRIGRVPLFGLPGNPVSCVVNFLEFVRPWLRVSLGDARPYLPVVEAVLQDDLPDGPGRARLLRVRVEPGPDGLVARSAGSQSSGVLTSVARGNGLLLLGVDAPAPRAGDRVRVQVYDRAFLDRDEPGYGW